MVSNVMKLATSLGCALSQRSLKLVTAESCTGGWVAKAITEVPGCSAWFERGYVTYSVESKQELLDVSSKTLQHNGVVSVEIAREMAEGALKQSHAQVSLAITGFAGPGSIVNSNSQCPVGTVCFAWVCEKKQTQTQCKQFKGTRHSVRSQAVYFALKKLLEYLAIP
jgi:nicotinamide-nucleotide amidase